MPRRARSTSWRAAILGLALVALAVTLAWRNHPSIHRVTAHIGSRVAGAQPSTPGSQPSVSDVKLLGQRIMVGLNGTSPDQALLDAVRRGQVGAVILFSANIVNRSQVRALVGSLQRAAIQGGNPPLLIAIDQEGAPQVKRFRYGPPFLSPPQMAQRGSVSVAFRQGAMTGSYLKDRGINMNLAPVLDVPTFPGAFIWRQGRAFSFDPQAVATYAGAFARGVQSAGVASTGKHFPGVGTAGADTDLQRDELRPSAQQRRGALVPYRALIAHGLDAVMLATAGFPAYDRSGRSAALSPPIAQDLLRRQLGFRGVSITDSLDSPTGHDEITAGVLSAQAGADILLFTDSAPGELSALLSALHSGHIKRADAVASYERIVALKRKVGH